MKRKWASQKSLELGSEDFSKGEVMGSNQQIIFIMVILPELGRKETDEKISSKHIFSYTVQYEIIKTTDWEANWLKSIDERFEM